jgi:hypothetical protein
MEHWPLSSLQMHVPRAGGEGESVPIQLEVPAGSCRNAVDHVPGVRETNVTRHQLPAPLLDHHHPHPQVQATGQWKTVRAPHRHPRLQFQSFSNYRTAPRFFGSIFGFSTFSGSIFTLGSIFRRLRTALRCRGLFPSLGPQYSVSTRTGVFSSSFRHDFSISRRPWASPSYRRRAGSRLCVEHRTCQLDIIHGHPIFRDDSRAIVVDAWCDSSQPHRQPAATNPNGAFASHVALGPLLDADAAPSRCPCPPCNTSLHRFPLRTIHFSSLTPHLT